MLPHEYVQPSDETEHVAIIVYLSQAILSMALELVPDIPLVKCDLDGSGGETEVDSVYLCEVDERFTNLDIPLSSLIVSDSFL